MVAKGAIWRMRKFRVKVSIEDPFEWATKEKMYPKFLGHTYKIFLTALDYEFNKQGIEEKIYIVLKFWLWTLSRDLNRDPKSSHLSGVSFILFWPKNHPQPWPHDIFWRFARQPQLLQKNIIGLFILSIKFSIKMLLVVFSVSLTQLS